MVQISPVMVLGPPHFSFSRGCPLSLMGRSLEYTKHCNPKAPPPQRGRVEAPTVRCQRRSTRGIWIVSLIIYPVELLVCLMF